MPSVRYYIIFFYIFDVEIFLIKIIQFEDQGLLPKGPVTKYVRTKFQVILKLS